MSATRILPSRPRLRNRAARPVRRPVVTAAPKTVPELAIYYDALFHAQGPQHWWPGRTRFEVIVGAILTQNTSWTNVERAIANLRREGVLSPSAIERIPVAQLARLIRSSGYFRQKARKLKAFVLFLREHFQGSLDKLFSTDTDELREQLLGVYGLGPETADSIMLYAGRHPVFVVDSYTRRILERHRLIQGKESYEDIRELFEQNLPAKASLFNEYHALIVHTGKQFCRKRAAACDGCALRPFLPMTNEVRP
jgi:endonuclease-3 related protein